MVETPFNNCNYNLLDLIRLKISSTRIIMNLDRPATVNIRQQSNDLSAGRRRRRMVSGWAHRDMRVGDNMASCDGRRRRQIVKHKLEQ